MAKTRQHLPHRLRGRHQTGADGSKSYYTKIGVDFPIKNGAGLALQMGALPVNGRPIILQITDDDRAGDAAEGVEA